MYFDTFTFVYNRVLDNVEYITSIVATMYINYFQDLVKTHI